METSDLLQVIDGKTQVNPHSFVELSKIIVHNSKEYGCWLQAQKMLFKIKEALAEEHTLLNEINPFIISYDSEGNFNLIPEDLEFLFEDENLYPTMQVIVWMMQEFYNEETW
jgi:succinyl-CoA synthetase beta subunit